MSALVQRALREPVPFNRDIPGADRKALEVLVAAGVLKKERRGKLTVFAPVVTLADFRKPTSAKRPAKRENVETWLRRDLAARAFIPVSEGWKETAWAKSHHRIVIGGNPHYFASYVADWSPWMKRALCRGLPTKNETRETQEQMALLFPLEHAIAQIAHSCWRIF